jgi:RimJ/RimL family protein N-acetyltransferase
MNITLRRAHINDLERVLIWRNEPGTYPWMGATRPLSMDEHAPWFKRSIQDPDCLFLIIECDGVPAGQLRYQLKGSDLEVSINITGDMHGKGIASLAFNMGNELVRETGLAKRIFAHVQVDNLGSIGALRKAGYQQCGKVELNDIPHVTMERILGDDRNELLD